MVWVQPFNKQPAGHGARCSFFSKTTIELFGAVFLPIKEPTAAWTTGTPSWRDPQSRGHRTFDAVISV
ncbi:hypothetical protein C8F00_0559 [Xanthomonas vasicola]